MNPRWAVGALLIGGALITVSAYFGEHQATLAPPRVAVSPPAELPTPAAASGGLGAVKVDHYAQALYAGRSVNVYGFGITALWRKDSSIPELRELQRRYEAFADRIRAIPGGKGSVYVYPFEAFHCTVAALVKFTSPTLSNASREVREVQTAAWRKAIAAAFSSARFPGTAAAKLVMQRPTLSTAAAIFKYENQGGQVSLIRDIIREAVPLQAPPR